MRNTLQFSWHSVRWAPFLWTGSLAGAVLASLVGSATFQWGPLAYAGKVFVALLAQPPFVGMLLVGATLLGGGLLGRRHPKKGWIEGLAFVGAAIGSGLAVGGLIRLAAGPETPAEIGKVYASASGAFLRVWLMLGAQLLLWSLPGMATGMVFSGALHRRGKQLAVVGAAVGLVVIFFAQTPLFQFAFPGGI